MTKRKSKKEIIETFTGGQAVTEPSEFVEPAEEPVEEPHRYYAAPTPATVTMTTGELDALIEKARAEGFAAGQASAGAGAADAGPDGSQRYNATLRSGFKMRDGMALQGDRQVVFEMREGLKVIVGPETLRPRMLLGHEIP